MQTSIYVFTPDIKRMKENARKLKREQNIPHTQALDIVAQNAGFHRWHHASTCYTNSQPTERAFLAGCILIFDASEGLDLNTDDGVIIGDPVLEFLMRERIFNLFAGLIDEDDPKQRTHKEALSPAQLSEDFTEFYSQFVFYRINENYADESFDEIVKLVAERVFWMPAYVQLRGELFDTYDLPALDSDGNAVGLRF